MFLHLGGGTAVRTADILAILDIGLLGQEGLDLPRLEETGRVVHLEEAGSTARSLVLTTGRIYLSVLSPATLVRRIRQVLDYDTMEQN